MLADEFAFPPQITRPAWANLARVEFPASSVLPLAGSPTTGREEIEALLDSRRADATGRAPTRTDRTTVRYQRTVRDLVWQAGGWGDLETEERLEQALAWFSVQHERWKPSTIRHHAAALFWAIERLPETVGTDLRTTRRLLSNLDCLPLPRPPKAAAQTSTRKRKSLTQAEFRALSWALLQRRTETTFLLAGLLGYGIKLGLRPGEFLTAFVRGNQLIVRCAKRTNGRALSTWRHIVLVGFDAQLLNGLRSFLALLQSTARQASSRDAFMERLSKALTRMCGELGIPPISLYTVRHQALANAKLWLCRRQVAALAGHVSPETSSRHYAHRRGGWGEPLSCVPAPQSVAQVKPCRRRPEPIPAQNDEVASGPSL